MRTPAPLRNVERRTSNVEPRHPLHAGCHYLSGWVRHRRHEPVEHRFGYRHALVGLDVDAGREDFERHPWFGWGRPAPVRFHRGDYLGPCTVSLREAVTRCVREQTGLACDGRIEILTQPRAWGFSFNPVSFYLCHDRAGRLMAIVAEITNTPWLERCSYALAVPEDHRSGDPLDFAFTKRFHISPFNPLRQEYRWRFIIRPQSIGVHMRNFTEGRLVFDATMVLARRPLSGGTLARLLRSSPLLSLQVALRIYLQARALWSKRAPFHPHPSTLVPAGASA